MGQGSEVAATTDIRRVLHVLRPLLTCGGFVLVWWLLATGAAQADAGPRHDVDAKNRSLTASLQRIADRPADRVADRVRSHSPAPAKVVHEVRRHVSPTVSATQAIVESLPVEPIVTATTEAVRSQVDQTVEETRAVLQTTPVAGSVIPELDGAADAVDNLPFVGESSTLQGESLPNSISPSAVEITTFAIGAGALTSPEATSSRALPGQHDMAPSSPSGGGSEGPALRSSVAGGASSVQSGSGSGSGAGLCETGLALTLLATKASLSSLADWQPAGPAYPPASTPD